MSDNIKITDIYEQNLNFIIGSGASFGFLPTLQLALTDSVLGDPYTIETLSVTLIENNRDDLNTLLFMYYFKKCIEPPITLDPDIPLSPKRQTVVGQYTSFLETIVKVLKAKDHNEQKCNIFTTNYDNCLELAAENLLKGGGQEVTFNDGTSGFTRLLFHTKNFSRSVIQKGIFESHSVPLPQINFLHLHGSINWKKERQFNFY